MDEVFPQRRHLPHEVPPWVADGSVFFITINAKGRGDAPLLAGDRPVRLWENTRRQMDAGRWWVRLFMVMPDHLHMMASFPRNPGMKAVIREWKRWTALTLGIEWQRDFFDHRIRNAKEYEEKAFYIRQNPVRKGLVADAREWPHT